MATATHRTQEQGAPLVMPVRQRADVVRRALQERLETIMPAAMREAGFDMWLILCQEDDLDPVFTTMIRNTGWWPSGVTIRTSKA